MSSNVRYINAPPYLSILPRSVNPAISRVSAATQGARKKAEEHRVFEELLARKYDFDPDRPETRFQALRKYWDDPVRKQEKANTTAAYAKEAQQQADRLHEHAGIQKKEMREYYEYEDRRKKEQREIDEWIEKQKEKNKKIREGNLAWGSNPIQFGYEYDRPSFGPDQGDRKSFSHVEGADDSRTKALGTLGLTGNPSPSQIKKAYYDIAKHVHPDKRHDNQEQATAEFITLHNAYVFLTTKQDGGRSRSISRNRYRGRSKGINSRRNVKHRRSVKKCKSNKISRKKYRRYSSRKHR
jgi:hypothetical protein